VNRRLFLGAMLSAPVAAAASPPDFLLVGDSLAYQLGPRLHAALKGNDKRLAWSGRGGSSTRQWRRLGWFAATLRRYAAPKVLVSLGVNCTSSERPGLAKDIDALLRLATDREVVWLLPPPLKFSTEYLTHAVMDVGVAAYAPGPLPLVDGIHPTDAGYRTWAEKITERFTKGTEE
jgi:hypothetical protein